MSNIKSNLAFGLFGIQFISIAFIEEYELELLENLGVAEYFAELIITTQFWLEMAVLSLLIQKYSQNKNLKNMANPSMILLGWMGSVSLYSLQYGNVELQKLWMQEVADDISDLGAYAIAFVGTVLVAKLLWEAGNKLYAAVVSEETKKKVLINNILIKKNHQEVAQFIGAWVLLAVCAYMADELLAVTVEATGYTGLIAEILTSLFGHAMVLLAGAWLLRNALDKNLTDYQFFSNLLKVSQQAAQQEAQENSFIAPSPYAIRFHQFLQNSTVGQIARGAFTVSVLVSLVGIVIHYGLALLLDNYKDSLPIASEAAAIGLTIVSLIALLLLAFGLRQLISPMSLPAAPAASQPAQQAQGGASALDGGDSLSYWQTADSTRVYRGHMYFLAPPPGASWYFYPANSTHHPDNAGYPTRGNGF